MNEPIIRVLHITEMLSAAGIESFIMNMYRNIDRDKVQFDFLVLRNEKEFYDEEIKSLNLQIAQMSEELGHLRPPTECQKDDEQLKPKGLDPAKNASTKKPSSPNVDNATSATAQ